MAEPRSEQTRGEQICTPRWATRDTTVAALLFVATAAVVLWQNARLAVLWDVSYLLDTSWRIALGQMPYRDFPFAHAPLTFVLQAIIVKLTGRVYFHHILYAAIVSGIGTVLSWRIALHVLQGRVRSAWTIALLLSLPLTVLGIYCIYPHPEYDCDCIFAVLVAVLLLQRLTLPRTKSRTNIAAIVAGASLVVPLFFKQNIGLPFLLAAFLGIAAVLAVRGLRRGNEEAPGNRALLLVLASAATTLLVCILLLHLTVGLGNYLHWTVTFAAQRRLPAWRDMLGVYAEPSLLWWLPCVAAGVVLLRLRGTSGRWVRLLSLALLVAPFVGVATAFFRSEDGDGHTSALLALWPLLLVMGAVAAVFELRGGARLSALVPLLLLATIHGTLLSQQLWGSTYALWPLLTLLLAQMMALLGNAPGATEQPYILPALTTVIAVTLLVCGGLYVAGEDRLSYAAVLEGPMAHSNNPALRGMDVRGAYLPDFDELLTFAAHEIPVDDGLILLNGEDPFYYATGRTPRFPVLLFDPATDPFSPTDVVEAARTHNIHWLIVKRHFQIREDPTPQREETMRRLLLDFKPYRTLANYSVYRRP